METLAPEEISISHVSYCLCHYPWILPLVEADAQEQVSAQAVTTDSILLETGDWKPENHLL